MELLYALLREACTYVLLSFLVVRFLSLIVSTSKDDSFSGAIKDNCKGVKSASKIDHLNVDDDNFGGFEFKEVNNNDVDILDKKIKSFDENVEFEELIFRDIDIVSSEVNAIINEDFLEKNSQKVVDNQEVNKKTTENNNPILSHQNSRDDQEVNKVVDQNFVGFEDKVGKNIAFVDQQKESNLKFEDCTSNHEIGMDLGREEVERLRNVSKGEVSGREFEVEKGVFGDDDEEWEGIERSELEKVFARAMNLVECKEKQEFLVEKMGNDGMMELYGLQKVAMEGPCHESQPMAIMRTARAKWNAWKKLGNMTREDAMEQYIRLLSDIVPEWMEDDSTISMVKEKSGSSKKAFDSSSEAN